MLQTVSGGFNLLQITKEIDSVSAFPRAIPLSIERRILTAQTSSPPRSKRKDELVHLRELRTAQPATHMGQVTWAWEEIKAALVSGMSPKEVWEAARLDGLEIPYPQFRVYVSRLRRRRQISSLAPQRLSTGVTKEQFPASAGAFKNLRERREKKQRSGSAYDPFAINQSLVDCEAPGRAAAEPKPTLSNPPARAPVSAKKTYRFEYPPGPPDESKLI